MVYISGSRMLERSAVVALNIIALFGCWSPSPLSSSIWSPDDAIWTVWNISKSSAAGRHCSATQSALTSRKVSSSFPSCPFQKRSKQTRRGHRQRTLPGPVSCLLQAVRLELAKREHISPFIFFDATLWGAKRSQASFGQWKP